MKRWNASRGFTVIEFLVAVVILGILILIGTPALNSTRNAMALTSAQKTVVATLTRARWMAITSGRPLTTVALSAPTVIAIRDGGTLLGSADVSGYGVTLSSADFPIALDGRGFLSPLGTASLSLTSTGLSKTVVLVIGPLGRVQD